MRTSDGDVESVVKRKTVATWIEKLLGVPVAVSSDYSFRTCLRDGVLLCYLVNCLKPGSIREVVELDNPSITEAYQSTTNVENFLDAVDLLGLPRENMFTLEDLQGGSWEQYPEVVTGLFRLQRLADRLGLPDPQNQPRSGAVYDRYAYPNAVPSKGAYGPNPPNADGTPKGISKLLKETTQFLIDRNIQPGAGMENQAPSPGVPPSPAMSAGSQYGGVPGMDYGMKNLGGMLQQMLSDLTAQQERRTRMALEERDEYVQQLEYKVQRFTEQTQEAQMRMEQNRGVLSTADMNSLHISAEELAVQLEEYRKANEELQEHLEAERNDKAQMEQKYVEMKSKVESLDGVHTKYKAIQSENRELYNMVQDLRGNIRVFCRVRPLGATGDASENCIEVGPDGEVVVMGAGNRSDKRKNFKFDKVFGTKSGQEEVYGESQPLIRSVLDGYNVCIFAYGQTGSGKTHTMSGTNVENYSGRGINYRALDDLFDIKAARAEEVDFEINVQMLEIYNELLRDLLLDNPNKVNKLDIRSTEKSGLNVPDAVQVKVECTQDVLEVMETGSKNRAVGGTKMNDRSSRSHSVLTVVVDGSNRLTGVKTHGCLHLVDLAGSERIARSEVTGDRMEEAKYINKSLSALGDVMSALAAKSSHVPFRNSKLTQLLQDSLSGQAKAMMFMHVAPEASSRGETLSTAMFGSRVSQISLGQAQKNSVSSEMHGARSAISELRTSAQSKDERIKELAKVVETERAAAKSAMSEKQRMESELKTLRDELNLTRRGEGTRHSRTMSAVGSGAERKSRLYTTRDPVDPAVRSIRRTMSISEHPRADLSARSTASRASTATRSSVGTRGTPARSSRLSTLRTSASRTSAKEGAGSLSNRPSTARRSVQKSTSAQDESTRSVAASKNTVRRPATAGPQNPRRIALAKTTSAGGWR